MWRGAGITGKGMFGGEIWEECVRSGFVVRLEMWLGMGGGLCFGMMFRWGVKHLK